MTGNEFRRYDCGAGFFLVESKRVPKVTFITGDGKAQEVDAPIGERLLEIAQRHGFDLEGACEGSMACSTCHVIVDPSWFGKLREASEEEEDMLDLAFGLTATSRLGCQIIIDEGMDGLVVTVPGHQNNLLGR